MSLTLDFQAVTAAIKALNVPGVNIKDTYEVPEGTLLTTPVLYPRPDNFITGFNVVIETFGFDGDEQATAVYTLNYRYLHCTLGSMGGLLHTYAAFLANVKSIIEAIMNDDTITGATNVRFGTIPAMGPLNDNAGNQYLGCDFTIMVEEYTGGA